MNDTTTLGCGTIIALLLLGLIILSMWGCPKYSVYQQTMRGTADFKEAEINRQILVEEARAQEEALQMRAQGEAERERIRAAAAADAIRLIGESLQDNEGYLRWLWITSLNDGNSERIYIPTEANLPLLEARSPAPPAVKAETP